MRNHKENSSSGLATAGLKKQRLNEALASKSNPPKPSKEGRYLMEHKGAKNKVIASHPTVFAATVLLHPRPYSHSEDIFVIADEETAHELHFHSARVREGSLILYQTNKGEFGLDFVSYSEDPWTLTRSEAFAKAEDDWVKMMYIEGQEGYEVKVFPRKIGKATWPEDIDALVEKIIEGRVISSQDHPIVQEYIQAELGTTHNVSRKRMSDDLDDLLGDDYD